MSGASEASARERIGEFDGTAACHGRARRAAVATTNAGEFRGGVTEPIRPSTETAVPPCNHGRSATGKEGGLYTKVTLILYMLFPQRYLYNM